ncbi:MAG: CapA family protein [Candidatus Paceibacterota bacterium]
MFAKELFKITLVIILFAAGLFVCGQLGWEIGELAGNIAQPLAIPVFFKAKLPEKPVQIFIVGDIMLDRGVEKKIKKSGDWGYPFAKIKDLFSGFNYGVANLEGPVLSQPPDTGAASMSFAFASSSIIGLKEAGINLVSLANNHTDNMGYSGLDETRLLLSRQDLVGFGHPYGCTTSDAYASGSLIFFAFNDIFPGNCTSGQLAAIISTLRQENATSVIMVMPHWGEEYSLYSNARQKDLAHTLVEAGADLVIGGHPHVVQEIEQYQGKLIFYSLGNFVFDQYFSKNTQQGLGLGLSISANTSSLTLWPLDLSLSQPKLMDTTSSAAFLQSLSKRSSPELSEAIKKCYIEIEHKP